MIVERTAELASESCKKRTCLLRPHSHYIDKIQCTVLRSPSILIFKQQDIEYHIRSNLVRINS